MEEQKKYQKDYVFGLDIGTRSLVGTVGVLNDDNVFEVAAMVVREHDTRSMIDGQIHDITTVGKSIIKVKEQLEKELNIELKDVCIAAAGRVLKTITVHVEHTLHRAARISKEDIYTLDMLAVEKAHNMINQSKSRERFYCVGYTCVKYYLDDNELNNLEGHKGKKIGTDMLGTFLPEDVVDGLYAAIEIAGLKVLNLTLEPIAAINVAIPPQFRMLNIALVDVGAGTSDISITKDGSIVAYGMIPQAGDEITETISKRYLVDFATAEKIKIDSNKKKTIQFKDIMNLKQKVSQNEVMETVAPVIDNITKEIADKIIELNGGKSVSAVFVVGGGGKINGFTDRIADYLSLNEQRVAVKGEEVFQNVKFAPDIKIKKDSLLVTPVGICISYYLQTNSFIFVQFNGKRIKLYNNNKLNVVNAAIQAGFPNDSLFPKRGKELTYKVDGKKRMQRGEAGEPCIITVNGKDADINTEIRSNDKIVIKESTAGKDAAISVADIPESQEIISFIVNGKKMECPKLVTVNGELKSHFHEIKKNDDISFLKYYTIKQLLEYADLQAESDSIRVNNEPASPDTKIYENFTINFNGNTESGEEIHEEKYTETYEESYEETYDGNTEDEM